MYFTYILFSPIKNKYYVGYTGDEPAERLRKHNSDYKGFTGGIGDWKIVRMEEYSSKAEAYGR